MIAWPSRTSLPFEGLGKGRAHPRHRGRHGRRSRREIPEARDLGRVSMRGQSTFTRERARISRGMSAINPVFAVMRNLIPAQRRPLRQRPRRGPPRRVVFLGDKLKQDLFGEADAVGQDDPDRRHRRSWSSASWRRRRRTRATAGATRTRPSSPTPPSALFSERYVEQLHLPGARSAEAGAGGDAARLRGARAAAQVRPEGQGSDRHLGHDRGREVPRHLLPRPSALFLGVIGSFTLMVGGHRRLEHHVRRGRGAHARDRHQAGGRRQARASSRRSSCSRR